MYTDRDTAAEGGLTLRANPNRVRVMFAGHVVADSDGVISADGLARRPIHFFPRRDVETGYLGKTGETLAHDVFGQASCYTWAMEGEIVERAVCAYEDPPAAAAAVRGYLTFDRDRFEIYELTPEDLAAAPRATHPHGTHV